MPTQKFPGVYENLAKIALFVRQAAQEAGLAPFDIYSVETAVDEACSNIIEHGYRGEGKGDIECTTLISENGLTIILRDTSRRFHPQKVPEPKLDVPIQERANHGLGLYFIYQLMDEVHFEYSKNSGNTLTLVKLKEKKSG
jgi:serine/threonine-protein kinase RsbW